MFSLCPNFTQSSCQQANEQQQFHHYQCASGAKQIKGGYLLRYKKQILWNAWCEEWVVLFEDSTVAFFTEPGRSSPNGKTLVKEAPEMLATSMWASQIPKMPVLPEGSSLSQLIAFGSRRKRSKVYWMLAQTESEVSEWVRAISTTLPPAPQIELVLEQKSLSVLLRRPIVRIRPSSNSEALTRRKEEVYSLSSVKIKGKTPVAIIPVPATKKRRGGERENLASTLSCTIPWGHGIGWVTSNGIWNGSLLWSQWHDSIVLHALPTVDPSNMIEGCDIGCHYMSDYGAHAESTSASQNHDNNSYNNTEVTTGAMDDIAAEDYDYAVDCGDFIF